MRLQYISVFSQAIVTRNQGCTILYQRQYNNIHIRGAAAPSVKNVGMTE